MISTHFLPSHPIARALGWRGPAAALFVTLGLLTVSLFGEDAAPAAPAQKSDTSTATDGNGNGNARARRANFNPEEMQARMMANMREQFGVADDAEWKLIADRITKVNELRRSAIGGGFGGFAGGNLRGGGNRQGANATANPEQDALREAVKDKLPDAEIKARLARMRDVRKQNEAKLDQAREDLRAVLSVRQEAVAVLAGLLP